MELARPTVCKATGHPFDRIRNHQKLVATTFPRSVATGTRDAPANVIDDQDEMFHCAASQGMMSRVLEFLADGNSCSDVSDRFGRTPLHWAAEQGHYNVVLALLRAGASVDPRSQRKATPIMLAASRGHENVVGVLLQHRAGLSDCWPSNRHRRGIDHWRGTALHGAAAGGHVRVVEALLDAGFDREQHDGAGLTPAEVSARQPHYTSAAITHLLLPTHDLGGKLVHNYVNMAVEDVGMVSGLVKGGAFLDWQDENGKTPLHRAAHFRHVIISRILLRAGADPNTRDHNGASPLHVAACTGCGEIVAEMIEAGADVEPPTLGGPSALHTAISNNRLNVVRILLNAGVAMENRDGIEGHTPLSWACERCLAPIVHVLVEAGAHVESRCFAGLTPLHWACRYNDVESVEILLNAGADPGAVDQAAAKGEVPKSSSTRGVRVRSIPVAVDVIGLGYPRDCRVESRRPSVSLAARRSDLVSLRRIELALKGAQQERSWRRRGWLVILAKRQASVEIFGARGERWAADRRGCSPLGYRGVDTAVEHSPCGHQTEAARCRDVQHPQDESGDHPRIASKRSRSIENVMVIGRGTSRRQGLRHGGIGVKANVDISLDGLVVGLIWLRTVEVGLFRTVVTFI